MKNVHLIFAHFFKLVHYEKKQYPMREEGLHFPHTFLYVRQSFSIYELTIHEKTINFTLSNFISLMNQMADKALMPLQFIEF